MPQLLVRPGQFLHQSASYRGHRFSSRPPRTTTNSTSLPCGKCHRANPRGDTLSSGSDRREHKCRGGIVMLKITYTAQPASLLLVVAWFAFSATPAQAVPDTAPEQ